MKPFKKSPNKKGAAASPRAWQRMLSGRRLDLLDPSPLDIEIEDIAHGLARVARWNGQSHGTHIYSVAQHCLLVEALARAKQVFTSGEGSTADQRAALDIVGLAADQSTFDALLARAKAVQDPLERMRILRAMALATDPSLSARMVDIALGPDTPAGSSAKLLAIAGAENPDSVWRALAPQLAKGALPMDQTERWYVVPAIAAASADPTRIDDVRRYGEQDMPADARRPVDAAVASIKLNERAKADALPDIDHWIASQVR